MTKRHGSHHSPTPKRHRSSYLYSTPMRRIVAGVSNIVRSPMGQKALHYAARKAGQKVGQWLVKPKKTTDSKSAGKNEVQEFVHDELTRRYTTIWLGKGHKDVKRKNKGCWKYHEQGQLVLNCEEGKQSTYSIASATKKQFVTTSGTGFNFVVEGYNALFAMNPNQATTGGAVYGAIAQPADDRIALDHVNVKYTIANLTTGVPVAVDIYTVVSKTGFDQLPDSSWYYGLQAQALGQNSAVQSNTAGAYTVGVPSNDLLDQRPDYIPNFYKNWKVLKHKRYDLASGAQVIHTYKHEFGGKTVDRKYLNDAPGNYIKGLTVAQMIIFRGGLVVDATANKCTSAACKLGVMMSREYVCHVPTINRVQTEYVVPTFVTGGATEKTVNVVDNVATISNVI